METSNARSMVNTSSSMLERSDDDVRLLTVSRGCAPRGSEAGARGACAGAGDAFHRRCGSYAYPI